MFKNKYYWAYIFNRGTALSFSHLVSIYWMSHVLGIVLVFSEEGTLHLVEWTLAGGNG